MIGLRALPAALALVALPLAAHAQTCLGLASFSAGTKQLAGSAEFADDTQAYTGTLTFGSLARAFGGVSVGTISYDAFDGNTTTVGVAIGVQIPVVSSGRVQMCPGIGVVFGFGPDNIGGAGTDVSSRAGFFGVQLGVAAGDSPRFRIVPTVGGAYARTKVDFERGMISSIDDVYGVLTLGVGLVIGSRLSILPAVDFTDGRDNDDPIFTVAVALNFGRPR